MHYETLERALSLSTFIFSIMLPNSPKLLLNGFIKVATYTNVGSKSHLLEILKKIFLIWVGRALGRWRECCSGKHIAQCLLTGSDFLPGLFGLSSQSVSVMLARILVWIWSPKNDFAGSPSVGFQRCFLEVWIYWWLPVQTASALVGGFAAQQSQQAASGGAGRGREQMR